MCIRDSYVTYLAKYAEELKNQGKGVVFFGSNFVVGLFGDASTIQLPQIEEQCTAMSSKQIKKVVQDKASFKFKEKGKKPINVAGVCKFMITGADFDTGRLTELLESQQMQNLA